MLRAFALLAAGLLLAATGMAQELRSSGVAAPERVDSKNPTVYLTRVREGVREPLRAGSMLIGVRRGATAGTCG